LSLYLVDRIGPLRRALMREGIAPAVSQPKLMRGEMVWRARKSRKPASDRHNRAATRERNDTKIPEIPANATKVPQKFSH